MPDDFLDDEIQELLGKLGIELGANGKGPKAGDLLRFACRVRGGHTGACLEGTHLLRELESLGQKVDQCGIDVVDAVAKSLELV